MNTWLWSILIALGLGLLIAIFCAPATAANIKKRDIERGYRMEPKTTKKTVSAKGALGTYRYDVKTTQMVKVRLDKDGNRIDRYGRRIDQDGNLLDPWR